MAINHIQTLQHDINDLSLMSGEYLTSALANLGQRTGIKGDSMITKSFKLKNLISEASVISSDDYALNFTFNNTDNCVDAKVILKETKATVYTKRIYSIDRYTTTENIELTSGFNGIQYYKTGGYITKVDDEMTTMFIGLDVDYNNVEFVKNLYDTSSNTLTDSIRIEYDADYGYMIYVTKKVNSNKYSFDIYTLSTEYTTYNIVNSELVKETETIDVWSICQGLIDNKTTGIDDILKAFIVTAIDETGSIVEIQLYSDSILETDAVTAPITIEYDTINNTGFSYSGVVPESDTYDFNSIIGNACIVLSNDLAYFYTYILEYYSLRLYKSTNNQLWENIVYCLCKQIYNEADWNSTSYNVEALDIFIPFDYEITYICNSNTPAIIYNSLNNIIVNYTVNTIDYVELADLSIILCNTSICDMCKMYEFTVIYNNDDYTLINGISINALYTFPYIDSNEMWVIDGKETSIKATGENAGNPDIIIGVTTATGCNILTKHHTDILNECPVTDPTDTTDDHRTMAKVKFVKPDNWTQFADDDVEHTYISSDGSYIYYVDCKLPDINAFTNETIYYEELHYATFMCMTPVNLISDTASQEIAAKIYGDNGYITTFWQLVKDDDAIYWANITLDGVALDMNTITSIASVFDCFVSNSDIVNEDKLIFNHIIFSPVNGQYKNNETNTTSYYSYPLLTNIDINHYLDWYDNMQDDENSLLYNITSDDNANDIKYLFVTMDTMNSADDRYVFSQSANRYLMVNNDEDSIISVAVSNLQNPTYANELYITDTVPTFDLSEVLVTNSTTINRINVATLDTVDGEGIMYNFYIGADYSSTDKTVVHFAPDNVNMAVGELTMISSSDRDKFAKQTEVSIDFPTVRHTGVTIKDNKIDWQLQTIDNVKYYTTIYTPFGEAYTNVAGPGVSGGLFKVSKVTLYVSDPNNIKNKLYEFCPSYYYDNNYVFLNINTLMSQMAIDEAPINIDSITNVIVANTNDDRIFACNDNFYFLITNPIQINDSLYTSLPLRITVFGNTLIIQELSDGSRWTYNTKNKIKLVTYTSNTQE